MFVRRPRARLRLVELERRDVPAWWAVTAPLPPEGTLGVTDASHAGQLGFHPDYTPVDGVVTLSAGTAAEAVVLALAGTVSVSVGGLTVDHLFGPATVGGSATGQTPFLAVATGDSVQVRFEDMAGLAGCDYDYNDRAWDGVTVAGSPPPPPSGSFPITGSTTVYGGYDGQHATVSWLVTHPSPDRMDWKYTLHNDSILTDGGTADDYGVVHFGVSGYAGGVYDDKISVADWVRGHGGLGWLAGDPFGSTVLPGETATFAFSTPPRPVVDASAWAQGKLNTQSLPPRPPATVPAPAAPPQADIDIDGKVNGADFTEQTEDDPGGLVVRRTDGNNALRKKVIVQKVVDGNGQVAPNGAAKVQFANKVKLFNADNGDQEVVSGIVYANADLPKHLWVEGVTASGSMRDVWITAEPLIGGVLSVAGTDEVAFTVAWVDLSLRFTGNISADNDKRGAFNNVILDPARKDKLGFTKVTSPVNGVDVDAYGYAYEAAGTVAPAGFSYPGVAFSFKRWMKGKVFAGQDEVVAAGTDKEDDSLPAFQDVTPDKLYDLDAPRFNYGAAAGQAGQIARSRFNFTEWVELDGVRASLKKPGFIQFSMIVVGNPPDWTPMTAGMAGWVAGDNTAGPGETNLTWNLLPAP